MIGKNYFKFIFLWFLFSLTGCASLINTSCDADIYGGVKGDIGFISQPDADKSADGKKDKALAVLGIIDFPFSLIADTILLPVNALQDRRQCPL